MRYSTLFVLMMALLFVTADGFLNIKKVFKKIGEIGKDVFSPSKRFGFLIHIPLLLLRIKTLAKSYIRGFQRLYA